LHRTDYDLKQHEKFSGKDLKINDPETNEKITPHVIEPAVGINRLFLMALIDSYEVQDARTILKLKPILAPYKVAVFPLLKNKPELIAKAEEVYKMLQERIDGKIVWDDRGNIGKRYLAQDEIGTPWCVTVDFESLEDNAVTVRERDDASQHRVAISDLALFFLTRLL
jgi:glycyl-tRNA synthetase